MGFKTSLIGNLAILACSNVDELCMNKSDHEAGNM
jgi:hypothetical protein